MNFSASYFQLQSNEEVKRDVEGLVSKYNRILLRRSEKKNCCLVTEIVYENKYFRPQINFWVGHIFYLFFFAEVC